MLSCTQLPKIQQFAASRFRSPCRSPRPPESTDGLQCVFKCISSLPSPAPDNGFRKLRDLVGVPGRWKALSRHMVGGMRLRKHWLEKRLRTTYPCDPHKKTSSGVSWTTAISSLLLVGLHSCSFSHMIPFGLFSVLDHESVWNTRHTLLWTVSSAFCKW